MALSPSVRRRLWRLLSLRTVLIAVPTVWLVTVLWTVHSAHYVQQSEYKRLLEELQSKQQLENQHLLTLKQKLKHNDGVHTTSIAISHRQSEIDENIKDRKKKDLPRNVSKKLGRKMINQKDSLKTRSPEVLIPNIKKPEGRVTRKKDVHHDLFKDEDHFEVTLSQSVSRKKIVPGDRFDPPNKGEHGQGVVFVPSKLSDEDRQKYDLGWKHHQFNEFVSLHISTQRETPDKRNYECKRTTYGDISRLPKVSVIICFYNEAWSVLLRTVHSVLGRSPPELIEEIILVDDFSEMTDMHKRLEEYVAGTAKLRLIRMKKRSGLVRARLAGVKRATGPVLVFLDSHVECATGWLTPLVHTIAENPKIAVTPEIDIIDHKTFAINPAYDNIGILRFDSFSFDWSPILPRLQDKRKNAADLIESPTMAGGLFAIRKDYFIELGTYDTELELWGGENIELSLKLWLCGGGIMIHPCSRVSHIFRETSPYLTGSNVNVLAKNSARVAQVWLDDYRKFYFEFKHEPYDERKFGSVQSRLQLKEDLKCRPFGWYIKNVFPEMYIQQSGRHLGTISSQNLCVSEDRPESPLKLTICDDKYSATIWELTTMGTVRTGDQCILMSTTQATLSDCVLSPPEFQIFEYRSQDNTLRHKQTQTCLTNEPPFLVFKSCYGGQSQQWHWPQNPDYVAYNR